MLYINNWIKKGCCNKIVLCIYVLFVWIPFERLLRLDKHFTPGQTFYAWTDILRLDIYTPKQTYAKTFYAWYFFRGVKFAYYAYSYARCTFHLTPGLYIWNWKWFRLDRAMFDAWFTCHCQAYNFVQVMLTISYFGRI